LPKRSWGAEVVWGSGELVSMHGLRVTTQRSTFPDGPDAHEILRFA